MQESIGVPTPLHRSRNLAGKVPPTRSIRRSRPSMGVAPPTSPTPRFGPDRVRRWSPEAPRPFAVSPSVDFASLSGESDWLRLHRLQPVATRRRGTGRRVLAGGPGSPPSPGPICATGQRRGSPNSAIRPASTTPRFFSVHPFAAWHAPSRGHLWASLGAGLGNLRHRDDLGFPSWSSSDVELRTYAAGASVPLADVLSRRARRRGRHRVLCIRHRGWREDLHLSPHAARERLSRRPWRGVRPFAAHPPCRWPTDS